MKIAFEARALQHAGGGVRTYVEQLLRHLRRAEITVSEIKLPLRHEALLPWWINYSVPRQLQRLQPDVVHFTKAAVPARKIIPTVVTIYDVIPILFPPSQKLLQRLYWPQALRHAASASDHIITISNSSKQDIIQELQVDGEKITVTPLAVDTDIFKPGVEMLSDKKKSKYILFVSTIEPRKNVPALVRAYAKIASDIPHSLIIAGRGYKGLSQVRHEIATHNLDGRVKILDFVSNAELPQLYAGADLFVMPSICEGWSFPVQEAMASGVPVIVSDAGPFPEVVGEAGIIVPFSSADLLERQRDDKFERLLSENMQKTLADAATLEKMRAAGLARVRLFSWQKIAEQTINVYNKVV